MKHRKQEMNRLTNGIKCLRKRHLHRNVGALLLTISLGIFSVNISYGQKIFTNPALNRVVSYNFCLDKNNNIYYEPISSVVTPYPQNVVCYNVLTGVTTNIAGTGFFGHTGDGLAATSAEIDADGYVAIDNVHNYLYISESTNNDIRKVDLATGIITTIAGVTGTTNETGNGGLATSAHIVCGQIAVDAIGNIYVYGNANIRKINFSDGKINKFAGTGTLGFSGNGGAATAAEIGYYGAILPDALGNVYIGDFMSSQIRMVNTSGIITAVAGNGTAGYSGDGGDATLAEIGGSTGLALDANQNLYIADWSGYIRKVTGGIISTIAGNGVNPNSSSCVDPLTAYFDPVFIAFDSYGNLFIDDGGGESILEMSNGVSIADVDINTLCAPGSSPVTPQLTAKVTGGVALYTYTWTATAGNTATLSSTTISNPTVTSTGASLSYSLKVTESSACSTSVTRPVQVTFKTDNTFDLAMRDSYYDMLDEPNSQAVVDPNQWQIWESQDLWNRITDDGYTTHQDPCTGSCTNYMYVKIRNVGCASSPATGANLHLYWTLDGFPETWPGAWTTDLFGGTSYPQGLEITSTPIQIPVIPAGGSIELNTSWTPPDPANYYPGATNMGLCFLARIEDGHSPNPYGMTATEGSNLSTNVRGNNNIVTRNTEVISVSHATPAISWLVVGNSEPTSKTFTLQFLNAVPSKSTLKDFMSITVSLGSVFDQWQLASGAGTYSSINIDNKTVTFNGTDVMELDNIPFAANEHDNVMLTFAMNAGAHGTQMKDETVRFRQLSTGGDSTLVYGANTYFVTYSGNGDTNDDGSVSKAAPTQVSNVSASTTPGIKVFPNPAYTTLNFQIPVMANGYIKLMDLTGRTMEQQPLNKQTNVTFDVQKYASGIYMYEVNYGKNTQRGKVVITK